MSRMVAMALLALPPAGCALGVGRVPPTLRLGDVVYRARVRTVLDSVAVGGYGPLAPALQAAVTVTNVGRRAVVLDQWPGCFFTALELWPTAADGDRPGRDRRTPAWDEERWREELERATGVIVECDFVGALVRQELAPGTSRTFERDASRRLVRQILGDSLRAGTYRAVVRIRPHSAPRDARPTLRLATGEVVLHPLASGQPGRPTPPY